MHPPVRSALKTTDTTILIARMGRLALCHAFHRLPAGENQGLPGCRTRFRRSPGVVSLEGLVVGDRGTTVDRPLRTRTRGRACPQPCTGSVSHGFAELVTDRDSDIRCGGCVGCQEVPRLLTRSIL